MNPLLLLAAALASAFSVHAQGWEAEARALRPADTSTQHAAVLDDLEQRQKPH